jgi:hypothetical protein
VLVAESPVTVKFLILSRWRQVHIAPLQERAGQVCAVEHRFATGRSRRKSSAETTLCDCAVTFCVLRRCAGLQRCRDLFFVGKLAAAKRARPAKPPMTISSSSPPMKSSYVDVTLSKFYQV